LYTIVNQLVFDLLSQLGFEKVDVRVGWQELQLDGEFRGEITVPCSRLSVFVDGSRSSGNTKSEHYHNVMGQQGITNTLGEGSAKYVNVRSYI
jgi:hypothetical protein